MRFYPTSALSVTRYLEAWRAARPEPVACPSKIAALERQTSPSHARALHHVSVKKRAILTAATMARSATAWRHRCSRRFLRLSSNAFSFVADSYDTILHLEDRAWTPTRSQRPAALKQSRLHNLLAVVLRTHGARALPRLQLQLHPNVPIQQNPPQSSPGWSGARTPSHQNGEVCQPPPTCLALEIGGGSGGGGGV